MRVALTTFSEEEKLFKLRRTQYRLSSLRPYLIIYLLPTQVNRLTTLVASAFSEAEAFRVPRKEPSFFLLALFVPICVLVNHHLVLVIHRLDVLLLFLVVGHCVRVVTAALVERLHAGHLLPLHFLLEFLLLAHHDGTHESTHAFYHHKDDATNHGLTEGDCHAASDCEHTTSDEASDHCVLWVVALSVIDEQAVDTREDATPEAERATQERRSVSYMAQARVEPLSLGCVPRACNKLLGLLSLPLMKYIREPPTHPMANPLPRSSKMRPGHGGLLYWIPDICL